MKYLKSLNKLIALLLVFVFSVAALMPSGALAEVSFLPKPGTMVSMSSSYNPMVVKGMRFYPDNPFQLDFILDPQDETVQTQDQVLLQSQKLMGYFLAALTTPESQLWVNLSPYEANRIIPRSLGQTEMGKDLLSQDYLLKQIMATALYPEKELGKKFWDEVHAQARIRFGINEIPVDTFNKVWIVPQDAVVYQNPQTHSVFVVNSSLKVLLESDYVAANYNAMATVGAVHEPPIIGKESSPQLNSSQELTQRILREIIIPMLEKEVNEGRNFAVLRQIYQTLILAKWFKKDLQKNILNEGYADRNKTEGIRTDDAFISKKIYWQYLKAYKKGVYNYISEEIDPATQEMMVTKYFSGGFSGIINYTEVPPDSAMVVSFLDRLKPRTMIKVAVNLSALFLVGSLFMSSNALADEARVQKGDSTWSIVHQLTGQDAGLTQKIIDGGLVTVQSPQGVIRPLDKIHVNDKLVTIDIASLKKGVKVSSVVDEGLVVTKNLSASIKSITDSQPMATASVVKKLTSISGASPEKLPVHLTLKGPYKIKIPIVLKANSPIKMKFNQILHGVSLSPMPSSAGAPPPDDELIFYAVKASYDLVGVRKYFSSKDNMLNFYSYFSPLAFKRLVYPGLSSAAKSVEDEYKKWQERRKELERMIAGLGVKFSDDESWMLPQLKGDFKEESSMPGSAHEGAWDIFAPKGTPVLASTSGVVVSAGVLGEKAGNAVLIMHPKKGYSYYAHLDDINVRLGQIVKAGQKLGHLGNTGLNAAKTLPHLHYERKFFSPDGSLVNLSNLTQYWKRMKAKSLESNPVKIAKLDVMPGGIDLGVFEVTENDLNVQTSMEPVDARLLRLLLKADGLEVKIQTINSVDIDSVIHPANLSSFR